MYKFIVFFVLCALFSSCGVVQKIPQDLSAEGAVTKEKVVNRTTKWYYQPDNYEN